MSIRIRKILKQHQQKVMSALERGVTLFVLWVFSGTLIENKVVHASFLRARMIEKMGKQETPRYVFSGHESFPCKSLWLKKGYDFVKDGHDFNSPDAVIHLGVGKNMVAAIRYWLKAFSLIEDNKPTDMADYLFDSETGKDPFMEDSGTLWLLHFLIVHSRIASLYSLFFVDYQKERKEFEREHILNFIKRKMVEQGLEKLFNPNTVKKDIGVLFQNYTLPRAPQSHEEYSNLLIDLDLLRQKEENKTYYFNFDGKRQVPPDCFLFALLSVIDSGDYSISFDQLQELGLVFCMNNLEILEMARKLADLYPDALAYNDVAGVRQLQIIHSLDKKNVLDRYYESVL